MDPISAPSNSPPTPEEKQGSPPSIPCQIVLATDFRVSLDILLWGWGSPPSREDLPRRIQAGSGVASPFNDTGTAIAADEICIEYEVLARWAKGGYTRRKMSCAPTDRLAVPIRNSFGGTSQRYSKGELTGKLRIDFLLLRLVPRMLDGGPLEIPLKF